jgi:hypothetical protein
MLKTYGICLFETADRAAYSSVLKESLSAGEATATKEISTMEESTWKVICAGRIMKTVHVPGLFLRKQKQLASVSAIRW